MFSGLLALVAEEKLASEQKSTHFGDDNNKANSISGLKGQFFYSFLPYLFGYTIFSSKYNP